MTKMRSILAELESCKRSEAVLEPLSFPQDTLLDDDEHISPIASTSVDERMVYVYQAQLDGETYFFTSEHSGGGVLVRSSGPFATRSEATSEYGNVPEGWTEH